MRLAAAMVSAVLLAACAPLSVERDMQAAAELAGTPQARLAWTDDDRAQAARVADELLARPLDREAAVRLALVNDASFQATLFEAAAGSARATQSGRIANPVLAFERLVRREEGAREIEIGRSILFPVLDLLTLPAKLREAQARQAAGRLDLAGRIIERAALARQAWVRAVAAREAVIYAEQVNEASRVAADLAARMQSVGNYSRLQRAREQAFHADAAAQLARARHEALAAREALVRALGLDAAQAARLQVPERLPELPAAPRAEPALTQAALEQRLDVRAARASLEVTARELGLTRVASWADGLQAGVQRNSETGKAVQRGFEVELPLPLFDFGDARRAEARATYMAAFHRAAAVGVTAASQLRESDAAYRTALAIARHHRDEVVPLRKAIAEEVLLRYNGMLASVYELLADAREQATAVRQALDAQRDFWLADAALEANLAGRPLGAPLLQSSSAAAPSGAPAH